jgi:hypothetical protein
MLNTEQDEHELVALRRERALMQARRYTKKASA